jgi:hypothetical protein
MSGVDGFHMAIQPVTFHEQQSANTVERKQGFIDQLAHLNKDQRLTAGTNAR